MTILQSSMQPDEFGQIKHCCVFWVKRYLMIEAEMCLFISSVMSKVLTSGASDHTHNILYCLFTQHF